MGELRESNDPEMQFPSSLFGFADWPIKGSILIDDIAEVILTKNIELGVCDLVTYNEYDKFQAVGLCGARAGRQSRERLNFEK